MTGGSLDQPTGAPHLIWIRGGPGAPERARAHVVATLAGSASARETADAALVVSELVTNGVVHAKVGAEDRLCLELALFSDRVHIAVINEGDRLEPSIRPLDSDAPGGFGLRLVDDLSSAWGVDRRAGMTRVWCDLPRTVPPDRELSSPGLGGALLQLPRPAAARPPRAR